MTHDMLNIELPQRFYDPMWLEHSAIRIKIMVMYTIVNREASIYFIGVPMPDHSFIKWCPELYAYLDSQANKHAAVHYFSLPIIPLS